MVPRLATEVEVEFRCGGHSVTRWLCTPEHLDDLATGWLVGEGRVGVAESIDPILVDADGKTVRIETSDVRAAADAIPIDSGPARAEAEFVDRFADPDQLRTRFAEMFAEGHIREQTGGIHTGALVLDGQIRTVREDVSRHCVIDKLIGAARREGLRLEDCQILLTSRVSGTIAAKLARAGVPVVATMSIPTTLAASIADRSGITIIGRARGPNPYIYRPGG